METTAPAVLELDLDALIAAVRKNAEENPDYVYASEGYGDCFYEINDAPSCLIGHGFFDLGFQVDVLKEFDNPTAVPGKDNSSVGAVLEFHFGITGTDEYNEPEDDRVGWLYTVQTYQDVGNSWAEAVATADERYPEVAK